MALHKKPAEHYDDFLEKLTGEHSKSIDDAIASLKDFENKGNRQHYVLNHFKPAIDKMYNTFMDKLHEAFDKDQKASVFGTDNEKKVKGALYEALKKYFSKTRPQVLETIKELGANQDDALEHLMNVYDDMHGVDPRNPYPGQNKPTSIRALLAVTKDKEAKVSDLIEAMSQRDTDSYHAWQNMLRRYALHHLGKFEKNMLMSHAHDKIMKHGKYFVKDTPTFLQQSEDGYASLIKAINYEDFEGINLKQYGLKKQEKKK